MSNEKIQIVIITYNCAQLTLNSIKSIYDTCKGIGFEVFVVDNASIDNTLERIQKEYPAVKIIKNEQNYGYSKAANIGVKHTNEEIIIVADSDIEYLPNAIEIMYYYLKNNTNTGIVGAQQQYPNGKWQYCYGEVPSEKLGWKNLLMISTFNNVLRRLFWNIYRIDRNPKEVGYVDGGVKAIRRKAFDEVNGFDEDYFLYTEEADFCLKLHRKNWKVIFNPKANVIHFRGGSTSKMGINENSARLFIEGKVKLCKKHFSIAEAKKYIKLELVNSKMMLAFWAIYNNSIGLLLGKSYKQNAFSVYIKFWKEELNKLGKQ